MNIIVRGISRLAKTCFTNTIEGNLLSPRRFSINHSIQGNFSNLRKFSINNSIQGSYLSNLTKTLVDNSIWGLQQIRNGTSLYQMHRRGPYMRKKKKVKPLDGKPFAKGVVLKTLIKKPKKPNSANRKCVLVRLSTGREMVAYVPGVGHNLQEHNIVLCRVGRLRDVPGVKIKCVRGKFDLAHVVKQPQR